MTDWRWRKFQFPCRTILASPSPKLEWCDREIEKPLRQEKGVDAAAFSRATKRGLMSYLCHIDHILDHCVVDLLMDFLFQGRKMGYKSNK